MATANEQVPEKTDDFTDQRAPTAPEVQAHIPAGQVHEDPAYPPTGPPSVEQSSPNTDPPPPYPGPPADPGFQQLLLPAGPGYQQPLPYAAPPAPYDQAKNYPIGPPQPPQPTTVYVNNSAQQAPAHVNIVRVDYGQQPNTYMGWSIFTTCCCCLVFGIVAIVKSSQVSSLWAQGKFDEARKASEQAKSWNVAGVIIGMIVIVATNIIRAVAAS